MRVTEQLQCLQTTEMMTLEVARVCCLHRGEEALAAPGVCSGHGLGDERGSDCTNSPITRRHAQTTAEPSLVAVRIDAHDPDHTVGHSRDLALGHDRTCMLVEFVAVGLEKQTLFSDEDLASQPKIGFDLPRLVRELGRDSGSR